MSRFRGLGEYYWVCSWATLLWLYCAFLHWSSPAGLRRIKEQTAVETKKQLCPYAAVGECQYGENSVLSPRRFMWHVWGAGPASDGCCLEITACKIVHWGSQEGRGALIGCAAQQGHGVWDLHGGRQSMRKPTPTSATSGSSPTATTPTLSSAFASGEVLSNLRARS